MENRYCTVCDSVIEKNYCTNCGQKLILKKPTILSMFSDIVANIFSLEKSVFAAIYYIIVSPNKLIDNYYSGYRNYYPSPGKILFYTLTYAAIHIAFISPKILGLALDADLLSPQIVFWIIILPFLTLTSYLSFITRQQKFVKHFVAALYFSGSFFLVIGIISDLLIWVVDFTHDVLILVIYLLFVFMWNSSHLQKQIMFFEYLQTHYYNF